MTVRHAVCQQTQVLIFHAHQEAVADEDAHARIRNAHAQTSRRQGHV